MGKGRFYILAAALLGVSLVAAACGPKPATTQPPADDTKKVNEVQPPKDKDADQQDTANKKDDAKDKQAGGRTGNPDAGKTIYANRCAVCHGANGEGAVGPAFVAKDGNKAIAERMSEADHIKIVGDGKNTMPGFKGQLTDQEIEDVVAYERTMK